jgi:hypothetical protein
VSTPTVPAAPAARPRRLRNPLQPLMMIIQVGFYLALAVFLIGVFNVVFRSGQSFGWHHGAACLTVPDGLGANLQHPAAQEVTGSAHGFRVCATPAGRHQAFYSTLANGLGLPFFLVAFGLTSRLLTIAAKGGVYRSEVVSRVRSLGWTLLIGEVLVVALSTVGKVHLYNDLVQFHENGTFWTPFWDVNWAVLLIGTALVCLARILREGVGMREDLEGTV